MPFSSKDSQAILSILDIVYSINDRSALFRAVCESLQKIIGFYSAIFTPAYQADPETEDARPYVNGYELFNFPEGAMIPYLDHYHRLDPFVTSGWWQTRNKVIGNTCLMPASTLKKSEFICDYLLPYTGIFYALGVVMASQGDTVGILGFHRLKSERDWSPRDKEMVNHLVPHLARAIRNLDLKEKKTFLTDQKTGILVTEKDGHPVYMNEEAKRIVGKMPLNKIPDPGFGSMPVFLKRNRKTYRVRTFPVEIRQKRKVILLERHPQANPISDRFSGFGLSSREKEIADLVIQGQTNRKIAEELLISEWTVKDHLSNIFEKCKVSRRSMLVVTLLRAK